MLKSLNARRQFLALAAAIASVTLLSSSPAEAREGARRSVGGGLKCYNLVTTDPVTGKVSVTQVCSKSI